MTSHEYTAAELAELMKSLENSSEDVQFAFGRLADIVKTAAEIRQEAGTEGMPAEISGNIDGVPYRVYLGPKKKEE